jgi:hypothetical protein|tara:strand:+ start:138 stop:317 length:180 start_codon:yes stop_codon:yes gene_type:complete
MKKKSKWQRKREKKASENSQFDPKIHDLGKQGFGFQMKKNYKEKPEELSGKNLPFTTQK